MTWLAHKQLSQIPWNLSSMQATTILKNGCQPVRQLFLHTSHKFGQVLSKPISGPKNLHTVVRFGKTIGAYTNVKFYTSSCEVPNASASHTWKFTIAGVNKGSPADSFKGSAHQKDPVDLPELTIGNRWHNCQVRTPRFAKEAKIARTGGKLKACKDPYKQATCSGMPLPKASVSNCTP